MYLLFDIGGTKMRLAVSQDGKSISEPHVLDTPSNFEDAVDLIKEITRRISNNQKILAAAGGVAGVLNIDKSILIKSTHKPAWSGKNIQASLQDALGTKVYLENDAAIVGLGEALTGPGIGKKIVAYITVSTGVGGARIVDGSIDQSAFGFEPGHQIIDPAGPVCPGCGAKGDLESFISGAAIEAIHNIAPEDINYPHIWEEAAKYLAIGLNNIILHWSPEIVVIGGHVMKKISLEQTLKHLHQYHKLFADLPEIELAKLDDYGGLYGALEFLKQNSNP